MEETKIKYIRGVEGRGEEILRLFERIGYNRCMDVTAFFEKPNFLYFMECRNGIVRFPLNSDIGKLIITHGEEMFLEPIYKYNTGDMVISNYGVGEITGIASYQGQPRYNVKLNNGCTGTNFPEEDMKPLEGAGFKIGDKVCIKGKGDQAFVIEDIIFERNLGYQIKGRFYHREEELNPYIEAEPEYKYKFGDKVFYGRKVCEITRCFYDNAGVPRYDTKDERFMHFDLKEEDLQPYIEPKYKVGDKVFYKSEVLTVEDFYDSPSVRYYTLSDVIERVTEEDLSPYTEPKFNVGDMVYISKPGDIIDGYVSRVEERKVCFDEYQYLLKDRLLYRNEADLKPYHGKFKIGDKVKVTKGFSTGKVGRISKREMLLDEPFYQVVDECGNQCGYVESALEKTDDCMIPGTIQGVCLGFSRTMLPTFTQPLTFTEEPEPQVKVWDDLLGKRFKGYFLEVDSSIREVKPERHIFGTSDKNVAASEKVAKSMLAMAQISQLMPHYGGAITDEEWLDDNMDKYCIDRFNGHWSTEVYQLTYQFVAFRTEKLRDDFMSHPENVQLVNDFLGLENNEQQNQ